MTDSTIVQGVATDTLPEIVAIKAEGRTGVAEKTLKKRTRVLQACSRT
jgi:hypothetical protein